MRKSPEIFSVMNRHIKIIIQLTVLSFLFIGYSFSQSIQNTIRIIDEEGQAVSGAFVTVGEGAKPIMSNENGEFFIESDDKTYILVEAEGYESKLITFSDVIFSNTIILLRSVFQSGEKDKVNMPFGIFHKRQIPGSVTVLDIQEILRYDMQNNIIGTLKGRVPGMFDLSNLRGNGAELLVVVDGIPRSAAEFNLQQIEQITILKDLSTAMLYGSQAANGVMLITTKRGEPLRKGLRLTAETGLMSPLSYPEYLSAADYMVLFNEALSNDGLPPRYSNEEITNTRTNADPVRYPNGDYYNSTYLNNLSSFFNLVGEASGGNEIANYYLNLGWSRENNFLKLGEGDNENHNRLNMRGNINYKVSKHIGYRFDGMVIFNLARTPRYTGYDFWQLSSSLHPNYSPVLIPASEIKDEDLLSSARLIDNRYILGGTSEYQTNIYGELTNNGFSTYNNRLFHLNTGLDFDLEFITPGLTASANLSMDMFNMFRADLQNAYAVYQLFYNDDTVSSVSKYGQDVRRDNQSITEVDFYRSNMMYGNLNYKRQFDEHAVHLSSLAYADVKSTQDSSQHIKNLHFGLRANYMYNNKYVTEFTATIAGSGKLLKSNPYAFSPGIGIAWIASEEAFFKDIIIINYFKIKANLALINTDMRIGYYMYEDWFARGSDFIFGQGTYNSASRLINNGNSSLKWEKSANANISFESYFLDYRLGFGCNYFHARSFDQISQNVNTLPAYFTGNRYQNYESTRIQGTEMDVNYNIETGKLRLTLGANFVYSVPKALIVDEIDYKEDYLRRQGRITDAMFGWVALGLFSDQEEIDNHAVQTFGIIKPGDIKYKDLNNDGLIDDLDRMIIGNSMPRLGYGLNILARYGKFDLFALGTGQNGQNTVFDNPYYWVFGDRKYSEIVWDRWTPETASTAGYPRLSSGSAPNNFRNSTYWIENNNWFRLQTIQLSYTLPEMNFAGLNEVRVYARSNSLLQVSNINNKRNLNIGSAPQTRDFSVGLTAAF